MLPELSLLGFDRFFQKQLSNWPVPPLRPARVAAVHRDSFEIWSAAGPGPARLPGAIRRQLRDESLPGVGDWVVVETPEPPGRTALIRGVLERRSVFTRGAAGRQARAQVVAANVDRVFVVVGLDAGVNLHGLDRYLARVWAGGAEPCVVLNKADLSADASASAAQIEARCPGVRTHCVSALRADGLDPIRAEIPPGSTVAMVGPSGAGKSTLANALLGESRLPTGAVQPGSARGRHTTTRRELVLIPGGGLLLDTPGMREIGVIDGDGLSTVFEDISRISSRCRFADCHHDTEPGCAVREAVASGALDPERLEHYRKLEREAAAFHLRHDARARRQAERVWGQLHDEAARLRRWKGAD
jgi:ribosome biogenesis GTPase